MKRQGVGGDLTYLLNIAFFKSATYILTVVDGIVVSPCGEEFGERARRWIPIIDYVKFGLNFAKVTEVEFKSGRPDATRQEALWRVRRRAFLFHSKELRHRA